MPQFLQDLQQISWQNVSNLLPISELKDLALEATTFPQIKRLLSELHVMLNSIMINDATLF